MPLYTNARPIDRATQAVAIELGALRLNQQHLAFHAKHSANHANSLFQPFWRAGALLFANPAEAFGLASAAH